MAGSVLGPDPGFPVGRDASAAAGHPRVDQLVLLGLSRQGAGRHRLSLRRIENGNNEEVVGFLHKRQRQMAPQYD